MFSNYTQSGETEKQKPIFVIQFLPGISVFLKIYNFCRSRFTQLKKTTSCFSSGQTFPNFSCPDFLQREWLPCETLVR